MKPYILKDSGLIVQSDGEACRLNELDASSISVPHLNPHVVTFQLDETEEVKVLIQYSCHCWTCGWEDAYEGQTRIMDATRPRAYDAARHEASQHLSALMEELPRHRIYVTRSDRNYGCYNASRPDERGKFYTAYFTLRPRKGKFDGVRYKFLLFVESAYPRDHPDPGMKTNFRAIVGKARENKMVKYRR